jgi:transposase
MRQLAQRVEVECGIKRCRSTVGKYRTRCGFTLKKAFRTVDASTPTEAVQDFCDAHIKAICIDEAGFHIGDHPRRGYTPRGKRLNVPAGRTLRRSKFTLILAVSQHGVVHYKLLQHNMKKADFVQFVGELPVAKGCTLLMDNLNSHHSKEAVNAVRLKGCTALYIPPYSPKYNAIENVFGTLKTAFRRQCPGLPDASVDYQSIIRQVIADLSTDLTSYFRHAADHSQRTLSQIERIQQGLAGPSEFAIPGYDT